jgi:hypothetical protein
MGPLKSSGCSRATNFTSRFFAYGFQAARCANINTEKKTTTFELSEKFERNQEKVKRFTSSAARCNKGVWHFKEQCRV